MTIVIMSVSVLYYCAFLHYYKSLFPPKKNPNLSIFIALFFLSFVYYLYYMSKIRWLVVAIVLILMMTGLKISTSMTWLQALYGGITSTIGAYSFRGVFTTVSYMVVVKNEIFFLHSGNTYYVISLLALPTALLFFQITRKTILPDQKLKSFLCNHRQLKMVTLYELTSMILLTIISEGRFLSPHIAWFNSVFLIACLLTIAMLIYCTYHSIRATDYLEYKWHNEMLEKQYALQLRHYKSYERYTESFRSFRHDYKSMLSTLRTLISKGNQEEAFLFLDGMYHDLQEKMKVYKKYSDNVILDAMLQDLATICEENHIHFTFKTLVPRNTSLSMIDAVRIFSNLSNNAVEACLNTPENQRFITITSSNKEGWSTLQIENSFHGPLILHDGMLETTKKEKINHGIGLTIVKNIVESAGGFMVLEADQKKHLFLARVHVPQSPSEPISETLQTHK